MTDSELILRELVAAIVGAMRRRQARGLGSLPPWRYETIRGKLKRRRKAAAKAAA